MVLGSAILLELALDRFEKLGVRPGVDFAPQDLFRTCDRERGDAVAQLLARPGEQLFDLGFRRSLLAVAFVLGGALRLLDHLRYALLRLGNEFRSALARSLDLLVRLPGRDLERLAPLLRRGEAVGDGLLPRL